MEFSVNTLAKKITRHSSLQTYLTIIFLVDKQLKNDCFKAYAYFRWLDDEIDLRLPTKKGRLKIISRQKNIINNTYRNISISDLQPEEKMIVDLVNTDRNKKSKLGSFIINFLKIIEFDACRKGEIITQKNLNWYTHTLSLAVTDGIEHFINHSFKNPQSADQYSACHGAHLTHILRDYQEDLIEGYYNLPQEIITKYHAKPADIQNIYFKKWVKKIVDTAKIDFINGKKYISSLPVLRRKIAGLWYCSRFEDNLSTFVKDGYHLRKNYSHSQPSQYLKIIGLTIKICLQHLITRHTNAQNTTKNIIIVGAGIGGLATAIKLSQKGHHVTILEKNYRPGGRCQTIFQDGHVFDTGPTMYLFPKIYSDFFASIGEDINQHIKLIPVDPTYQLNFPDNTSLVLTSNHSRMKSQLENIEKGSYQRFLKYIYAAQKHYRLAMDRVTTQSLSNFFQYFNLSNLFLLLKTNALKNHYSYAKKFFKHPHLLSAFTFQDSYLGLNPFQTPSIFSLFSYSELTEGSFLPQGGMYQIITALEKIAIKNGVTIKYGQTVNSINLKDKRANGVILSTGKIKNADVVVFNPDLSYVYNKLLPDKDIAKKILQKEHSCSAIVFHWGLDKKYSQLKTHNLFFSNKYKETFFQVINHATPPNKPHFYIQAPSKVDFTRAPKNHETISVMVPINHLYLNHSVDWKKYRDATKKYIISRLKQVGMDDIERHIKFEKCYLPPDWEKHLNLTYGSVYGLHHNLTQLGYLREKRQHPKYKNVFFVGCSNHPGNGLPTVLLSAQFTAEEIINRY